MDIDVNKTYVYKKDIVCVKLSGSYMIFDPSASQVSGAMYSPRLQTKSTAKCLEFSYHMKTSGSSTTSLRYTGSKNISIAATTRTLQIGHRTKFTILDSGRGAEQSCNSYNL